MSQVLDELLALGADFEPMTASLSPDTQAVLFYFEVAMQQKRTFLAPGEVLSDITDAEWDTLEAMVATALKELMTPMIGQIIDIASAAMPPNVLECDGATYERVDYPDLYATLDSAFILNADQFAVPDLRGLVVIGKSATLAVGDTGGEVNHQLTVDELASHTHSYNVPEIPTLVFEPGEVPVNTIDLFPSSTGSAGGDQPHNNMQPYLVLRKGIIAF